MVTVAPLFESKADVARDEVHVQRRALLKRHALPVRLFWLASRATAPGCEDKARTTDLANHGCCANTSVYCLVHLSRLCSFASESEVVCRAVCIATCTIDGRTYTVTLIRSVDPDITFFVLNNLWAASK
jgi:hypothetical protein